MNEQYLWALGEDLFYTEEWARYRLVLDVCAGLLERVPVGQSEFCDGPINSTIDMLEEFEEQHVFM